MFLLHNPGTGAPVGKIVTYVLMMSAMTVTILRQIAVIAALLMLLLVEVIVSALVGNIIISMITLEADVQLNALLVLG